ncbi:hypothetical protein DICPUDRAFT_149744 [Dictyostelium purpureum]|uniref:FNIP repeat-containing protein n=1 Tax=Dictyostelium purpureum TaxID=5786 RepID=F0ZEJ9_DICPU|nr:uncharacterized protein DICPUDRAFT_149744 [Dictyostelium purpureum]EGC37640.1 hypothetical protein DICPUDRAFT_149744 [Dictyostelium purpureum]|eukprot:XP_003285828.1 hypothetical protein DICPUDRAFT_149744 [Dictyostelium purpureum]
MYNNNNNNSNINNINNNNDKFFIIWKNNILRNKILTYNKLYNEISKIISLKFDKHSDYYQYNDNINNDNPFSIKSISINGDSFKESKKKFLEFLNQLSPNINSLKISHYFLLTPIPIEELKLPETLKEFKFGMLCLEISILAKASTLFNYYFNYQQIIENSPFKYLESLQLGPFCDPSVLFYLPDSIKRLELSMDFPKPITKLPKLLNTLIIVTEYDHPTLNFPPNLKNFEIRSYKKDAPNTQPNNTMYNSIPSSLSSLSIYLFNNTHIDFKWINDQSYSLKKVSLSFPTFLFLFKPISVLQQQQQQLQQQNSTIEQNEVDKLIEINNKYINNNLKSLKSLSNIKIDLTSKTFDIGIIPQNIKSFKICHRTPSIIENKYGIGFPKTLKKLQCENFQISFNFQDPSNLKKLILFDRRIYNSDSSVSDLFLKFNNLKSLRYITLFHSVLLPPLEKMKNITNLEMVDYSQGNIDQVDNILPNHNYLRDSSLKSIMLDTIFTGYMIHLMNQHNISPFPSTLRILDLNFSFSEYNINIIDPNIIMESIPILSQDFIPPSTSVLIIRGDKKPSYKLPLPLSLQFLFIADENEILKDQIFFSNYSNIITTFSNSNDIYTFKNSKIFKKFRKYLLK